jgi:hypothetical protein
MVKFGALSPAEICISSLVLSTRVPESRHLSDSCLTARINGVTVALALLGGEENARRWTFAGRVWSHLLDDKN